MDSRAWEEGGGRQEDNIRPTHHTASGLTKCVGHRSQNQTWLTLYRKQQRHLITSSKSQKEKMFFPSDKLSNKRLILSILSISSGTTEYPVQYGLNFKEKLLQLPLIFPRMSITPPGDLFQG